MRKKFIRIILNALNNHQFNEELQKYQAISAVVFLGKVID